MAKEKGRLKRLGVLLVLMLAAGLILTGQGLAGQTPVQPDQSGSRAALTVVAQVYDAGASEDEAAIRLDRAVLQTTRTVASQVYARPDQIVLTWTADPRTTQTVSWRVYGTDSGKVQYMLEDAYSADFSGALEKDAVCSELYAGFNHFEAELDNLQPGTTYAYRVGTDGCWSEPATFTTATATDNFSFMFMGDVHAGYYDTSAGVWQQLLAQARADYPDIKFALQAGDLVNDASDPEQWSQLFGAAAGVFDHIPLMSAAGNHESNDSDLYIKYFALPQNGPAGYEERHYSFDYGNAHFVVLDSSLMGSEGDAYRAGINWLESDLQNSSKKWKFVMFHVPAYTVYSGGGGYAAQAEILRQCWLPVLERNGVDMVFVGHQHMYMRTYPIYEGRIQENPTDGITYLMGNAGNKFYVNPEQHDYIAKVLTNTTCYTVLNIDGDVLTMTTRDAEGNVVDEYKINKGGNMAARVTVSDVKLLNSSYQEISSVPAQGSCRLQAHLNNNTSKRQTVVTVFQLRSGNDAEAECGGESLGIASLKTGVPTAGADVYADFTLPDSVSAGSKIYVDVYVLDEVNVPIDEPYQKFSFDIL
jgi:hypothetical protein